MANRKEVWTVCPRGEGKKDFWLRVGTAFENRDGSWSLMLDALPVNGKLIMRDERERDRDQAGVNAQQRGARSTARNDDFGGGGSDDIPF